MAEVQITGPIDAQIGPDKGTTLDAVSPDGPPSKKFKQGRLPFKPLEASPQLVNGTTPVGSKKRKLSDNESPSAKLPKTSIGKLQLKPAASECDPEVSSSSEADIALSQGHQKGAKKVNTLDRFFKPKTKCDSEEISSTNECKDTEEITSTNECVAIDLTDDMDCDTVGSDRSANSADDVQDSSPVTSVASAKFAQVKSGEKPVDSLQCVGKSVEAVTVTVVNTNSCDDAIINVDDDAQSENKENISENAENESDLETSFVSNASVLEAAIKTPSKDKPSELTLMKTPSAVGSSTPDAVTAKPVSHSAVSVNDEASSASEKKKASRPMSASKRLEMEEKRKQREREREERKLQKEKERDDKERERLEKKRQKDEEKAEKERAKQEEKDKREKERLEKLAQKEEEKKKKEAENEAKNEDKKKRDEEKRQKEGEKKVKEEQKQRDEEEKEKKQEKATASFKSFFMKKTPVVSPPKAREVKNSIFMPFEMKTDMRLAPSCRRPMLRSDSRDNLDELLAKQDCSDHYLKQLKSGASRWRSSVKTWPRELKDEHDVEILCHDEETIAKVTHHVKFLYFHENYRPPYYGTFRKTSTKISGRNPVGQDNAQLDYEVESDDEWEEEEPGESVSSDEEEDEKEKHEKGGEDEADADGWMVPHGYLSDDEGIADEEMDLSKKHEMQSIRQQQWESELKRQAQPLRMIAIGCCWHGDTATIAAQQLEKLMRYKAVCLRESPIHTGVSRACSTDAQAATGKGYDKNPTTPRPQLKAVPEEGIPDLIRLVHGNPCGLKNLVKEFRMFWKLKTSPTDKPGDITLNASQENITPDASQGDTNLNLSQGDITPNVHEMSMEVDEKDKVDGDCPSTPPNDAAGEAIAVKPDEFAISKRQLEIRIPQIAVRERRAEHKKVCWYVHGEVLKQYGMEDIKLPNSWQYVCIKEPKWASSKPATKSSEEGTSGKAALSGRSTPTGRALPTIKQFAQPMSPSQIQAIAAAAIAKELLAKELLAKNNVEVKSEANMEVSDTIVIDEPPAIASQKASLPSDQKSIKEMFARTPTNKNCQKKIVAGKNALEALFASPKIVNDTVQQCGVSSPTPVNMNPKVKLSPLEQKLSAFSRKDGKTSAVSLKYPETILALKLSKATQNKPHPIKQVPVSNENNAQPIVIISPTKENVDKKPDLDVKKSGGSNLEENTEKCVPDNKPQYMEVDDVIVLD